MAAPQTAARPTGLDGVELNPEDAAFVDSSDTNAAERALGIDLDGDGDIGVSSRDLVSNPLGGGDSTGALDRGNSSGELKALDMSNDFRNAAYHRDLRKLTFDDVGRWFGLPPKEDGGERPGAIFTIARYLGYVFLLLFVSLLGPPLSSACVERVEGRWPTDHWLFYTFCLGSVVVMYVTLPLFSYVLTGDYFDPHGHRKKKQTRRVVRNSVLLCIFPAIVTIIGAAWQAKTWGFPMYFTQITAGMPGLFLCTCFCAALIRSSWTSESSQKVRKRVSSAMPFDTQR
jgi:hypothetical protein